MDRHRFKISMIILALLAVISICITLGIGPAEVSVKSTVNVICDRLPFLHGIFSENYGAREYNIIWKMRMPRVLLGFITGASLAVCGVSMQALIRNKLADPFVLGVSSGSSAFATVFMITGWFSFLGMYALAASAFIGAAVSIIVVYAISKVNGRVNITHLLLTGVAVSMIMDAFTKAAALGAKNALAVHNLDFWMTGSLAGAKWSYLGLPTVVIVVCIAFLMANRRSLNALLLGDDTAVTLGVNVPRIHKLLVLVSSLLAGVTVAVSGSIGFIGMMVPHICRMIVGSDHKRVIPMAALLGGCLVIWADAAARIVLAPEELPVGILTAIIGGPCFIIMLKSKPGRFE